MFAPVRRSLQRRGASFGVMLMIVCFVVLLHAVLLHQTRFAGPGIESGKRPGLTALQVRALHPAAVPVPSLVPSAETKPRVAPSRVTRPPAPSTKSARPLAGPLRVESDAVIDTAAAPLPDAEGADAAGAARPSAQTSSVQERDTDRAAEPIPTYPTSIPAAFTQVWELRRGALVGRAELIWRPAGDAYEARLSAGSSRMNGLEWVSRGGFDAAGVAPVRFTDQRRGRAAQAVNFQRAGAGTISYSGPAVRHELLAGAQDRLSWIVQLVAIAQGGGASLASGASIVMFVTGARGDGDLWLFMVAGVQAVGTASGSVDAVKLVRAPRKPYDTLAEIWLDPARGHLPVRLRLSAARGDALEFVLQETSTTSP